MRYNKKQMIISADDFGMCPQVNEAIIKCVNAGLVSSMNVIVNMEDFSEASRIRFKFPNVSIGIHWNVTSGKPILPHNRVLSLVNPETQEFWGVAQFQLRVKKGLINIYELRCELIEQYKRFKEVCGNADYWNTHQNSAFSFGVFSLFNTIALELGILSTRTFRRVYIKPDYKKLTYNEKIVELLKKLILDIWFGVKIPGTGTKLPDGRLIYFDECSKTESLSNIGENIMWRGRRTIELVIHPSVTNNHEAFGTLSSNRVTEFKLFSNVKTLNYLTSQGINIVNFNIFK